MLDAAPQSYTLVLTAVQMQHGDKLTLLHLSTAMNAQWLSSAGGCNKKSEENNKLVLSAFGGVCFTCKKKWHKAHKCPDKKANSLRGGAMGKFNGKCNNCGKQGHKEVNCWAKEENKDKRPAGYKVREQGNANVDTSMSTNNKVEFLLCGMTFPQDHCILTDPNVWIADTAATVHTTPYSTEMHKCKQATDLDTITVGNGTNEQALRVTNMVTS